MNGGIIGLDDLAQYRAIERRPLVGRYRGHLVYSAPPPVSSGAGLIETLQILDHYTPKPRAHYTSDADYFHYLIEAWKVRDPIRRISDPERWDVDLGNHLEMSHAAELFKRIDPARASLPRDDPPADRRPEAMLPRIGQGTTAFAVGDADGNMIAVTQTLSTWGGTFYVSDGLGFLYNNHLRSSRTTIGYGQMLPLQRSSSTSVPTILIKADGGAPQPRLAVACAGNAWITASVYNIITTSSIQGCRAQRAIEAPRFLVGGRDPLEPQAVRTQIEDRIPARDASRPRRAWPSISEDRSQRGGSIRVRGRCRRRCSGAHGRSRRRTPSIARRRRAWIRVDTGQAVTRFSLSPWLDRVPSKKRPTYERYRGETTAEVVIVGGGLTGCATAYALAAAGIPAVLLEADRIGQGGTAGCSGLALQEPYASFRALAEQHGIEGRAIDVAGGAAGDAGPCGDAAPAQRAMRPRR